MLRDTDAICKACEVLGGQAPLARLLGVSSPTVNQWVKGRRPVPIEHCPAIEAATQGAVRRWQLRANDWRRIWPELQQG
jgi:DNA-binding transcriptional regulator YdaS (Cro superfamily)